MKKNRLFKVSLLSTLLFSASTPANVIPDPKHSQELHLMSAFLSQHHYQNAPIDDEKSREILANYIDYLDPLKTVYTQEDIDTLKRNEVYLDDFILAGNLQVPFAIYNDYVTKRLDSINWMLERLKKPFSDDESGTLEADKDKIDWASDKGVLEGRWRAHLINHWIVLRLAGQSDEKARELLTKRYQNIIKHLKESRSDEVFYTFANAITQTYGPHTTYFSPRESENFNISMKISLEGIGASLGIEEEVITIKSLVAGGPAKKSGKIQRNDKILAVAQGENGTMEDVVGARLSDAVSLIRGARGTTVRLRLQKGGTGEIVEISLVRDKIKLADDGATSSIKEVNLHGKTYRIGVIDLPIFYTDSEAAKNGEEDYPTSARDVKRLLEKLKKEKIDGLIVDLRDNSGGSLSEAVSLTGLFISEGPVVQVLNSNGELTISRDKDKKTTYDGPLVVLVNNESASASEIFAGAVKDYGRGLVIGEPTFGKGSVQTMIRLGSFLPDLRDIKVGDLKLTIAMFFRINGSSTQINGVLPDIYIPSEAHFENNGEVKKKHVLPWRKIDPTSYQYEYRVQRILPQLRALYDKRKATDPMTNTLLERLEWLKKEKENTLLSLNLNVRREEQATFKEKMRTFENRFRTLYGYPTLSAADWDKKDKDKTDAEIEAEKAHKIDPILNIATQTAADYVQLIKQPS